MAVLVFPLALTIAFFPSEILLLWTGDTILAQQAAPILVFLIAGTAINGVMFLPYALQLAHGWTSLALAVSSAMCIAMVPAVYYMATHYGPTGAAAVWLMLNVMNLLITFPLTHRRLLPDDAWEWISKDVGLPLFVASVVTASAHQALTLPTTRPAAIITLGLVFTVVFVFTAASASRVRPWLFRLFHRIPPTARHNQI